MKYKIPGGFIVIGKIKQHKVLIFIVLLIIIAIAATIIVINIKKSSTPSDAKQQKQSTITLEKKNLTKSISATGTIESKSSKTVSASVNDISIEKVNVSVGDSVKKGDTLVTFDKSDLQDTLEDARETLSDAQTESSQSISSARKQLSDARAAYSADKAKANTQVSDAKKERKQAKQAVSKLKKQISSTKNAEKKKNLQEQLTKAQETLKQAESGYETAVSNRDNTNRQNESSITNAENSVTNAESSGKKSIKEAQKQVDEAQKNLDKCTVTAPISGVITAVNIEENDIYNGGDMFQIDDTSSFIVSTTVDEYDISDISVGQRVVILTETTDEDELEGKITFVSPSTSTSSGSSQTGEGTSMSSTSTTDGYEVKIAVTSTDERLKMGLTAKCSIILEEANDVFAVPYDAIQKNSNKEDVIQISTQDGTSTDYQEIVVTKGMESDYYVEISGDELSEGMQVVIPTDEISTDDNEDNSENQIPGFGNGGGKDMSNGGGNRPDRGNGGGMPGGGAPNK